MRDEQVLFAFTPAAATPDKVPVLIFMISEAAWAYAKKGMGHEFDLTELGIPLKVLIGRTKDNAEGMKIVRQANQQGIKDVRHVDIKFPGKPRQ